MMANSWTECWTVGANRKQTGGLPFCAGQGWESAVLQSSAILFCSLNPGSLRMSLIVCQNSHLLHCLIKSVSLVSKKQFGHHLLAWTENTDSTAFYCSPKSLALCSRFWRASDGQGLAGLPLYSCHFAASRTECLEDDTCWAPAASACGVCLGRIVAPIEASG